jgi:hypothetical protein
MSTEKKTDPSNEQRPTSGPEVNEEKKGTELSQQDLDRVTGGRPFPLNPQPLPP